MRCLRCDRVMVPRPIPLKWGRKGPNGVVRPKVAGLCSHCYVVTGREGTRLEYCNPQYLNRVAFFEDRAFLLEQGLTERQVCEKLSMKWDTYTTKLRRARRMGLDV